MPAVDLGTTINFLEGLQEHKANVEAADEKIAELERQQGELHQLILDLSSHTRPFDTEPDNANNVKNYLVSAGALHRVLGTVGHSAAKCHAEDEVVRLTRLVEAQGSLIEKARDWWRVTSDPGKPNFMYELRLAVEALGKAVNMVDHHS